MASLSVSLRGKECLLDGKELAALYGFYEVEETSIQFNIAMRPETRKEEAEKIRQTGVFPNYASAIKAKTVIAAVRRQSGQIEAISPINRIKIIED